MSTVEWRPVVGYEGLYEVSSEGQVRSLPRTDRTGHQVKGGIKATKASREGYPQVTLCRDGSQRPYLVHRLVAAAFLGPRPEGMDIRHLDGNPADNRLDNLAYGTRSENNLDAVRHGTHHWASKTHCPRGHPYDEANTYISPRGHRWCDACRRERQRLKASDPQFRERERERSRRRRAQAAGLRAQL